MEKSWCKVKERSDEKVGKGGNELTVIRWQSSSSRESMENESFFTTSLIFH